MGKAQEHTGVKKFVGQFLRFGVLAGIIALDGYFYFSRAAWLGDEGMLLSAGLRLAGGDVLYRDLFEFWPPLAPYLAAGLTDFLGNLGSLGIPLLWGPRLVFGLNILLISGLTFLFSKKLIRNPWLQMASPLVFLTSIASGQVGFSHNWLALNLAVLAVWLSFKDFKWKWIVLGVLSGLTLLTIQTQGLALMLWCFWFLQRHSKPLGFVLPLLRYFLGLVFVLIPVFSYFAYRGAISDFLSAVVVFPLAGYHQVNLTAVPNKLLLSLLVFYLGYGLLLKVGQRQALLLQNRRPLKSFLILSIIFTLPALFTPGPAHTAYVFPFVLPLIISAAEELAPSLCFHRAPVKYLMFKLIAFYGILLVTVDFGTRLVPNFYKLARYTDTPLRTSVGTLYTWDWQAEIISDISRFIEQNTRPGEYVLAAPYSPIFYVINDIKNPTRYSQLTPGYNSAKMFEETIAGLEAKKPRYIIFYPSENPFKFDENNLLSQYVLKNYSLIKEYPPTYRPENKPRDGIYERKNSK